MNQQYKCVLSIGIRCFTEIFLKELGFKKFSSPFDGLYLSSINDIIYLLTVNLNHCNNNLEWKITQCSASTSSSEDSTYVYSSVF